MSQPQYTPQPNSQELSDAALPHILGIIGWLGALIGWLINKDKSPRADYEGKKALNFQITLVIGLIALWIIYVIALVISTGLGLVVSLLFLAVFVVNLVLCIQAYQAVKRGEDYKYPFSLALIK